MRFHTNISYSFRKTLRTLLMLVCGILFSLTVRGQQDPLYSQYLNNLATINPAYVGVQESMNIKLLTRHQWTGFEGAPTTSTLAFTMPYQDNQMGFGGRIVYDGYGPVTQLGVYGDYAYHLDINPRRGRYLSFGISAGFNLFYADILGIGENQDDPAFIADMSNKFLPNVGIGIMYRDRDYLIGVSVPKLIENQVSVKDISRTSINKDMLHIYLLGAYKFKLDRDIVMKLATTVRYIRSTNIAADLHAFVTFYNNFTGGIMYRTGNSFGMSMQYDIREGIRLGYAYDMTSLEDTYSFPSTHELMLSYDIPSNKRRRYRRKSDYFF
ncbi:type IX secretion system membrane protein PorP/SprF [Halosquirtibacter xylanolyticus]|uniref:PorP/SprF family type IX secretion system membrane protein n=1 Tax=Halosquirtibacter xylanolyticus TaxID=3374599 RepID=UPI00374A485F|nr:type IX secretion system membrane protein PorP/SprF [Prolixibacteraceae bacterium]